VFRASPERYWLRQIADERRSFDAEIQERGRQALYRLLSELTEVDRQLVAQQLEAWHRASHAAAAVLDGPDLEGALKDHLSRWLGHVRPAVVA
jgi:hypothetical protein